MKHSVAILGLGNISQGYDYDDPDSVLTHANAFAKHPSFSILGGVDPDPRQRERFTKKFSAPAFSTLEELLSKGAPDVVVIATPLQTHYSLFKQVMLQPPKLILCEKPLALRKAEADEMEKSAATAGTTLAVNYIRRFEPGCLEVRRRWLAGEWGKLQKGVVWYSGGVQNIASHFIDYLVFLFGAPKEVKLLSARRARGEADFELDFSLQFGEGTVVFQNTAKEAFDLLQVNLVGERGLVELRRGGEDIRAYGTEESLQFPGYRFLREDFTKIPSDFSKYQWHVACALAESLDAGTPPSSSGKSAAITVGIVAELERLSAQKG